MFSNVTKYYDVDDMAPSSMLIISPHHSPLLHCVWCLHRFLLSTLLWLRLFPHLTMPCIQRNHGSHVRSFCWLNLFSFVELDMLNIIVVFKACLWNQFLTIHNPPHEIVSQLWSLRLNAQPIRETFLLFLTRELFNFKRFCGPSVYGRHFLELCVERKFMRCSTNACDSLISLLCTWFC